MKFPHIAVGARIICHGIIWEPEGTAMDSLAVAKGMAIAGVDSGFHGNPWQFPWIPAVSSHGTPMGCRDITCRYSLWEPEGIAWVPWQLLIREQNGFQ